MAKHRGRSATTSRPARRVPGHPPQVSHATASKLATAVAHHQAGRFDLAAGIYRVLLANDPHFPPALHLLGLVAFETGNDQRAVDLIKRAIANDASVAQFHANLGVVLRRMDRLEEALQCVERAARLDRSSVNLDLERAQAFAGLGRPAEAIAAFEKVMVHDPQSVLAHFGVATAALALGDFRRGWAEYEWRWQYAGAESAASARGFLKPLWDGRPRPSSTILLHAEQGLGDTLQFARYAPLVRERVGRVVLECQAELRDLLAGMPGVDVLVTRGEELPEFDVQAPLMSLPWLLGTSLSTIPDVLSSDQLQTSSRISHTVTTLPEDGRLRVGLVWAGGPAYEHDHKRSVSLAAYASMAGIEQIAFFALQKGQAAGQVATPHPGLDLTDLGPALHDFCDTANFVSQLDLVITVDTAVAHLAAAMGRPVWVLLALAPDFRWLVDRDDSPWYPTARLFRQTQRGDWTAVLEDVSGALAKLVQGRSHVET